MKIFIPLTQSNLFIQTNFKCVFINYFPTHFIHHLNLKILIHLIEFIISFYPIYRRIMYSAAFLQDKLPFETGKQHKAARQKIWKKIDKSIPNYIKIHEAKKFIKSSIQIHFKYDLKQEDQQIIEAYDYAKNLLTPLKNADKSFAQQTVSKSEFKYFLRHMRLYYQTLFAWKKFQSHDESSIPVEKLRKVIEKMRQWGHLYLNGWDSEKIYEVFGVDGTFSLKNLIGFVFSAATKFQYNKEGEDNLGQHRQADTAEIEDKIGTNISKLEIDKTEENSFQPSEQLKYLAKVQQEENQEELLLEPEQQPVHISTKQQTIYADNQQEKFYPPLHQSNDLHQQRIKYSYLDLFQMAKDCFYSKDYEEGLNFINQCIQIHPQKSILYSNRALFYAEIELVDYALADLYSAIELNHLNYIAYFNIFSILTRLQRHEEAFDNLSCALSCLYLIKAKNTKSQIDATKAIKYAQNNVQAHVLKAMMHLENGKIKLALNELNWACELNPKIKLLKNVKDFVIKQLNPEDQLNISHDIGEDEQGFIRLEGSYHLDEESQRARQVQQKVSQFNRLYLGLKSLSSDQLKIYVKTTTIQNITQGNEQGILSKDIPTIQTLEADVEAIEN